MPNSKELHPGTRVHKFIKFGFTHNCSNCNLLRRCNVRRALKEYFGNPWEPNELCCSGWGPKGTTLMR